MREDWSEVKLEEVCINITDGSHFSPKAVDAGRPYITVKDIVNDKVDFEYCKKISEESYLDLKKNGCKPEVNDLLFSKDGTVGKVAIVENDSEYVVLSSLAILKTNIELIEPRYLFHVLKSNFFLRQALNKKKGVAIRRIILRDLRTLKLNLAPLPKQRIIVSKIETLFSDLDKGIEDLNKAKDQLDIYRQAVLKKAFEGELTKEWRESFDGSNEWKEYTFEGITESLKRGPFGGDLKKAYFVQNGYAVYEQQHAINDDFNSIRYFIDEERYKLLKACNVGPGDYIVSCSGTMGRIARLPDTAPQGVINQALMRIRIDENVIEHDYFLEFFKSQVFQRLILQDSRGSGMQNMAGIKEIKPIKINLPSRLEQKQIVREIESRISVCDKVEQSIEESLEKAKALRQSILKKAFEGTLLTQEEIEKCKAEKDYEPAAVLLERIRKEKNK